MKRILSIFLFFHISTGVLAQQSFILSGTIKDKQGHVLPGAGVYVSGYKIATSTNDAGIFSLSLKPGNYDILVQMIGYKAINKNIVITDKNLNIQLNLEENSVQLNEVTITADPNRQGYIRLFTDYFIGTTPNAAQCKILNPEILYVDYDKEEQTLKVKTTDFLIIENKALGYRIKYLVNNFEYNYKTRIIYYEGYPYYEDLKGSAGKIKKWAEKRLTAYQGSAQHFFTSLYHGKATEEGFLMHKLRKVPNPARPSDSLISVNLKKYSIATLKDGARINLDNDSLNYWAKKKRLPKSISVLSREIVAPDTLVHKQNEVLKYLNFSDVLYVIYTKEREDQAYANLLNVSISRPLDIPDYQISLINAVEMPVYFYQNGGVYNPKSMIFEGYWAWEKIADSVPMDYLPPGK
ncbi:carboxypeptidase-like regulatory domain-containing protein [Pedobacter punctiformis]|uniref:Carboxypeptidase-like regulatory domain-containing protein n=1 Tax=Pedobacter punctiformis TaxID=3004097 RepID=A0ABT4LCS0_9SPHI|nr:carboxypeptidase-like regulatory domain-containing protein [Pedobacter sp. HCMS5-2]MCZ4245705.1 carboxypeptidase-like regulatory domain-containing protein [Pedobacter sp. HCMS5-2]